ncbi:MAG: type II secretion system protein GspE, partial [Xanthomonadaceae bacterium]|nr:type II secretion system protein GspE [Xanthomonadaceae bacterium]
GLYELIAIDDTLRRLIHEGASERELLQHARQRSPSLADDGWNKVCARITSVEEVLRVSREGE